MNNSCKKKVFAHYVIPSVNHHQIQTTYKLTNIHVLNLGEIAYHPGSSILAPSP